MSHWLIILINTETQKLIISSTRNKLSSPIPKLVKNNIYPQGGGVSERG